MRRTTSGRLKIMRLLLPLPPDRRLLRLTMLLCGLVLYGLSSGLILQAGLGVDPWDVLHQGLARTFGGQVGTWAILASVGVLVLWLPLRARFGVGTLANAVLVGVCINLTVWLVPAPQRLAWQGAMLVAAVALNAFATGLYIGAGFGPGPRDGLTTAVAARGHSIRLVRTVVEVTVLAAGWLLGGSVGVGTVLYAVAIGPLTHLTIPLFALGKVRPRSRRPDRPRT
ncbi:membrane protein [Dactylosporangium matsuzakiense]|uniref:Membrane protein n=2 Tax=Dactylosporangium matsuzakiense TaxID=53360 RepID=A0A9W6KP63_9ACTN|nr:membrane protein [Dactylosporangium matsuzakiense]